MAIGPGFLQARTMTVKRLLHSLAITEDTVHVRSSAKSLSMHTLLLEFTYFIIVFKGCFVHIVWMKAVWLGHSLFHSDV
jgi:hypothetical protein